jgi:hemoglobin/transferrin/lactoferrin receptor protein
VLAKLSLRPAAGHTLRLALEGRDQDADVVVRRLSASLPRVVAMEGNDHAERLRGSLEWQHQPKGGWYDRLTARLHHQTVDTANHNRQTRSNTSATCSASAVGVNNCHIEQDFFFEQTSVGGGVQAEKTVGNHFLTLGLDLARVSTEEKRDARVWNLTTGGVPGITVPGNTLAGDTFPLRDFAVGHTDSIGLFVQDEIALADGKLALTPGLRYDWRKLQPEPDALSQAVLTAIGKQVAEQSDGAFSPRIAALWRLSPEWSAFGHLAGGFRAPNYEEVNGHFRNTAQSYGISPNPGLEPETSVGVELGLRLNRPGLGGQFTVYDNRYRDFIESVRLNCPADPDCIAGLAVTYMSRNLSKVRIYGAELRATWDIRPGWRLNGALAHAHGDNQEADQPLNSIEPTRLSLALVRDAGTWGAEARLRAAGRKDRVDDSDGIWFRVPGYGVTDLSAWWKPGKNARVTLAVNNILDRKYWLWSDIRQADSTNPAGVDFYSQPGRNLAASFEYKF